MVRKTLALTAALLLEAACRRSHLRSLDPPAANGPSGERAGPLAPFGPDRTMANAEVARALPASTRDRPLISVDSSAGGALPVACARDEAFPSPWLVPEASAAAEVQLRPGTREILVISDSGRMGAAMAWRSGAPPRSMVLPLDAAASDDLEGMAWVSERSGAHLYTLTSSGAVRRFAPNGAGGLRRDDDTYRIGAPPLSCSDLRAVNCGKNWEGLCLRRPDVERRCAGYAASKSETSLYCVTRGDRGRLAIDPSRPPIPLSLGGVLGHRDVLSDCAFGAEGGPAEEVLLVTTNVFGGSTTYVVDEATGRVVPLDVISTPSNEAIAVDSQGAFYAFMDDNGETSIAARFACTGWNGLAVPGH